VEGSGGKWRGVGGVEIGAALRDFATSQVTSVGEGKEGRVCGMEAEKKTRQNKKKKREKPLRPLLSSQSGERNIACPVTVLPNSFGSHISRRAHPFD